MVFMLSNSPESNYSPEVQNSDDIILLLHQVIISDSGITCLETTRKETSKVTRSSNPHKHRNKNPEDNKDEERVSKS
jgi:hypothetical protein